MGLQPCAHRLDSSSRRCWERRRSRPSDLKPGDQAPAFSLPGSDGRTYSLADFKGKQAVVLAWFPKAFTGG